MAHTRASLPTRKRILSVCIRLFLEQGYKNTTLAKIVEKADVSFSSFQNLFRAKDGVLTELVDTMFLERFSAAHETLDPSLPPVYSYAVEAATQLALTELDENLRDIYVEAYTREEAIARIHRGVMPRIQATFGGYQQLWREDYFALEVGTSAMMRGFMAQRCDNSFTLEEKVRIFLAMSMDAYHVPQDEQKRVQDYIASLDLPSLAEQSKLRLYNALSSYYEFSLKGLVSK